MEEAVDMCKKENAKNEVEDKDSIVSDRCFEEMYKGDSRKWLLRDRSVRKGNPPTISTMKDEYRYPFYQEFETVGKNV